MLLDGRIIQRTRSTRHLGDGVMLTCENHPNLRWNTKNIGGYDRGTGKPWSNRHVFYFSDTPECPCSIRSLIIAPEMRVARIYNT